MHPFPCCGSSLVWQKDKPDRKLLCDTTPPKSRRNSLQEDDTMAGCGDHESPSSPRVNAVDSSDSNPPPDPHNNNAGSATGTGTGTGTGTCSVANASTSVCGILHKWVNLGRGWRSRWFVLRDGVLSYYKIHGSHKIFLSPNTERNCRVIGEESLRVIRRSPPVDSSSKQNYRPFGELHLKVSSIRESRSDERRFTIFTGTKHLHLRTDTKEDRTAWIEALKTGKAIFPDMSANEGTASNETVSVSMERLRSRLMQEGLSNVAVKDIEQIMMGEVSTMLNQLKCFKKQNASLLETLRQLETEKFDLENKVVDESQHRKSLMLLRHRNGRYSEGSIGSNTDSDDENERHDAIEEEIEDENAFFDTKEFLSSASFRSDSENALASADSDEGIEYSNCAEMIEQDMETVGFQYPVINRRSQLPEPKEKEKGTSLWSIIKDNIGKDLTKVCLPVYFNEPISSLQKCFEDLEYSYLLDRAQEWGKRGNSIMRAMNVAAFAVSSYASTEGRHCKPFNPLLGETYEADFPDKGIRFISEKVSHHPMVVACHCSGNGWKFWGDSHLKSKFWGRSIQLDPVGILTLEFDDGEVYTWSKVTTAIYNLILGKIYCEHFGTMVVQSNRGYTCKVKFKEQTIMDRNNPHQVQGVLHDGQGRAVSTIFGKWHESLYCVDGDLTSKSKSHNPLADATLLWKKNKPAENPTRYNLTQFAITLNELTPGLKEKLPPTDSRLRPDQRHLENGEYDMANKEKLRLEQRQRQARILQEQGWKPQWFHKGEGKDTYEYAGGYWEAREKSTWESCPDVFGQNITDIPVD